MNFVAPITAVDVFITDSEADEKRLEKIKTLEITAIVK